jgi:hypothetical protein
MDKMTNSGQNDKPGYATPILYGPDYNHVYFILIQSQVM